MAYSSFFWPTDGTGHGPANGYTADQWRTVLSSLAGANDGVLRGQLAECEPTVNGSSVRVAAGRALVNGALAESDANVDLTPVVPQAGTTGLRAVWRWDKTNQTATVELLEAADGVATPPAVTSTATVHEFGLATAEITTGGVIESLVDTRPWIDIISQPTPSLLREQVTDGWRVARFSGMGRSHVMGNGTFDADFAIYWGTGGYVSEEAIGLRAEHGSTNGSYVNWHGAPQYGSQEMQAAGRVQLKSVVGQTIVWGWSSDTNGISLPPSNAVQFVVSGQGSIQTRTVRGGTATITDTGIVPDGTSWHALEIRKDDSLAEFLVDGSAVAQHATNIPDSGSAVRPHFGSRSGGTAGGSVWGASYFAQKLG